MNTSRFQAVCAGFLRFIGEKRESILESWAGAVHEFGRLSASERRTPDELRQRLAEVIDELASYLSTISDSTPHSASTEASKVFALTVSSGFPQASEVVPEIASLRMAMVSQLIAYEEEDSGFHGRVKVALHERVHQFFDNIIATAVRALWQRKVTGLDTELRLEKDISARAVKGGRVAAAAAESESVRVESMRELGKQKMQQIAASTLELQALMRATKASISDLCTAFQSARRPEELETAAASLEEMDSRLMALFNGLGPAREQVSEL